MNKISVKDDTKMPQFLTVACPYGAIQSMQIMHIDLLGNIWRREKATNSSTAVRIELI